MKRTFHICYCNSNCVLKEFILFELALYSCLWMWFRPKAKDIRANWCAQVYRLDLVKVMISKYWTWDRISCNGRLGGRELVAEITWNGKRNEMQIWAGTVSQCQVHLSLLQEVSLIQANFGVFSDPFHQKFCENALALHHAAMHITTDRTLTQRFEAQLE